MMFVAASSFLQIHLSHCIPTVDWRSEGWWREGKHVQNHSDHCSPHIHNCTALHEKIFPGGGGGGGGGGMLKIGALCRFTN